MQDYRTTFATLAAFGLGAALLFPQASGAADLMIADTGDRKLETIRVSQTSNGQLQLPVSLNGRSIQFLVDTGATNTLIDDETARLVGVEIDGSTQLETVGGTIPSSTGRVARLDIGPISLRNLRVLIVDDLSHPLLGMDVIRHSRGVVIQQTSRELGLQFGLVTTLGPAAQQLAQGKDTNNHQ